MDEGYRPGGGRLSELDDGECRELLAARSVGRVAFTDDSGPLALPVNYVVMDDDIVFSTSAHNIIAQHLNGRAAAFEIDDVDEFTRSGWSVLVRGSACFVEAVGDVPADRRPTAWPEGIRSLLIRIPITSVTGRRVHPS